MNEFGESAVRSAFIDLTEATEDGQFIVCHAHVRLELNLREHCRTSFREVNTSSDCT